MIRRFDNFGGSLFCDYRKNTVSLNNFRCILKRKDYKPLEYIMLVHGILYPSTVQTHKDKSMNFDDVVESEIKTKNQFLDNREFSFRINKTINFILGEN